MRWLRNFWTYMQAIFLVAFIMVAVFFAGFVITCAIFIFIVTAVYYGLREDTESP